MTGRCFELMEVPGTFAGGGADQGESFLDRLIALVEGAIRQRTPNEIALTGEAFVNVLEINLQLRKQYGQTS